jgi:hypothetical protein
MKVAFRQGIVSHQSSTFLLYNTKGKVDLRAEDRPVVVTLAHQYTDYTFTEDLSIESAWNGPFEKGTTYWLFWDFDISGFGGACPPNYHSQFTCKRKFLHTDIEPIVSDNEPVSPNPWQMWYDKINHKHYEWNGVEWVEKLRVFACKLDVSSNIIPPSTVLQKGYIGNVTNPSQVTASFIGSQIGDNTEIFSGRPLYTEQGNVIRRDDGTFFTTEDQFFADKSRVDALRLESNVYRAQSMVPSLDSFSVVAWDQSGSPPGVEDGRIRAAGYDDTATSVIGILTEELREGEVGAVIIQGSVTNPNWNWLNNGKGTRVGDPLWIVEGRLFYKDPNVLEPSKYRNQRPAVARVLSNDTVVFQQGITGVYEYGGDDGEGTGVVPPASTNDLGIVRLSVPPGSSGGGNPPITEGSSEGEPVVVETTDPRLYDNRNPKDHGHAATQISVSGYDPLNNVQEVLDNIGDQFVEHDGDTMTGALVLDIPDPSYPRNPNDAVPKKYVDKLTSGLLWRSPIALPNLIGIYSVSEPAEDANFGDTYVIAGDGDRVPGEWGIFLAGNVVQWLGAEGWVKIANSLEDMVNAGFPDRFGVGMSSDSVIEGDAEGCEGSPPGDFIKNAIVDRFGTKVFDPCDLNNMPPPSPAVAVISLDYPLALENPYAEYSYMWNGTRWIQTSGSSVNFADWIHGNKGTKFSGVDPESTNDNSAAIGSRAVASGVDSIAFGTSSKTSGEGAIGIGKDTSAEGKNAISIGTTLSSGAEISIALGTNLDDALKTRSILIGSGATSENNGDIFIGNTGDTIIDSYLKVNSGALILEGLQKQIFVPGHYGERPTPIDLGVPEEAGGSLIYDTLIKTLWYHNGTEWKELSHFINWIHANNGLNFVTSPVASATDAIAIGNNSTVMSPDAISIGTNNDIRINAANSISVGKDNIVLEQAENAIAIGFEVGKNTTNRPIQDPNVIAIGTRACAFTEDSIAIGYEALAVGSINSPLGSCSIAIGDKSVAGNDSVVIGSRSTKVAPDEGAPSSSVVVGTRTYTNKSNSIVIGDSCYIDITDAILDSHKYQGEFIKIGGSAGSNMFMMMLGDPGLDGDVPHHTGGQFVLHAPHSQFVIPGYNPNAYFEDQPKPHYGIDDNGLPNFQVSKNGGLIYDQEHPVEYDVTIPGPAADPGNLPLEKRVKIFPYTVADGAAGKWENVAPQYLYELKDTNINYLDPTPIEDGAPLIFLEGQWVAGEVNNNTGGSIEVPYDKIEDPPSPYADLDSIPLGTPMYFDGDGDGLGDNVWRVACADLITNVHTAIFAEKLEDTVVLRMSGEIIDIDYATINSDGSELQSGTYYYLSPDPLTPGKVTIDRPEDGDIVAPVWQALGSDNVLALPFRAGVGGGGGGAGGGGIITVPNSGMDLIPPIGTPMYFDGETSKWKLATAGDIYKVHTCVFASEEDGESTLVITGEVIDINPAVNDNTALLPGHYYYLRGEGYTGKVTKDKPESPTILAPVWQALTSTTAFVLPYRAGRTPLTIRSRADIFPTVGQIQFLYEYTPGNLDVFVNGTLLHPSEYTALDGWNILLVKPAEMNDVVTFMKQTESSIIIEPTKLNISKEKYSWTDFSGTELIWDHNIDDVDVFVNGVLLDPSQWDTNGAKITLEKAVTTKDVVNAITTYFTEDVSGDTQEVQGTQIFGATDNSEIMETINKMRKEIKDLKKELSVIRREL